MASMPVLLASKVYKGCGTNVHHVQINLGDQNIKNRQCDHLKGQNKYISSSHALVQISFCQWLFGWSPVVAVVEVFASRVVSASGDLDLSS
jgi:hypothetical protein